MIRSTRTSQTAQTLPLLGKEGGDSYSLGGAPATEGSEAKRGSDATEETGVAAPLFGADDVLGGHWTWYKMAAIIGGEAAVERITSQMTTLGVLSALIVSLSFGAVLSPPAFVEGAEGAERDDPVTVTFGVAMLMTVTFNVACVIMTSHVVLHLNSCEWDTETMVKVLKRNQAHLIVSFGGFVPFLLGLVSLLVALICATWKLYSTITFVIVAALTAILVVVCMIGIAKFGGATIGTHMEKHGKAGSK